MKFAAVLALAAVATVASAQTTKICNTIGLLQVVGGTNGLQCSKDSGYSATSGTIPTDAQYQVLCFSEVCENYRNELKAKEPEECIIRGVFAQDTPLYATLITPIADECKRRREASASPSPSPSDPKPTVTPSPPAAC